MLSLLRRTERGLILAACAGLLLCARSFAAPPMDVSFVKQTDHLDIRIGDRVVATYVFADPEIPRPYFCNVMTMNGTRVTRNHPPDPVANKDNDDHAGYHPGLWLAFGDINGNDFWRNKARVRHVSIQELPGDSPNTRRFSVVNRYESTETPGAAICEETCVYSIRAEEDAYFIVCESELRALDTDVAFGDQEEMGFGLRLNTPLTVKFGTGTIVNSAGGANEKGTWGKTAEWCAGIGRVDNGQVGAMLMPDPRNFRPSWFHSRDYGLIVANPFAKKAMTAPDDDQTPPDSTRVATGKTLRIGFGVCIFEHPASSSPGLTGFYDTYLESIGMGADSRN
ncbi:MAG: PmoA family protein [Candidatus Hydrogenedentes bacterium]|nr:PmoA family protein [Candidatus Hydrogenedentota bacterium]